MPTLRNYALLQWSVTSTFVGTSSDLWRFPIDIVWGCKEFNQSRCCVKIKEFNLIWHSWSDNRLMLAHEKILDKERSYSTWLWVMLRILTASSSQARTSDLSAGNRFCSRDVLRSNSLNMGIKIYPEKLSPPYFQSKFRFGIFPPGQLCKTSFATVHNHIFSVHCL